MFVWVALGGILLMFVFGPMLLIRGQDLGFKGWIAILVATGYLAYLVFHLRSLIRNGHSARCMTRRLIVEQANF